MAICDQLAGRMVLPDNEQCVKSSASRTFLLSDSRYIGIGVVQEICRAISLRLPQVNAMCQGIRAGKIEEVTETMGNKAIRSGRNRVEMDSLVLSSTDIVPR